MNKFNLGLHSALFSLDWSYNLDDMSPHERLLKWYEASKGEAQTWEYLEQAAAQDAVEQVDDVEKKTKKEVKLLDKDVRDRIRYNNLTQDQYWKQSADLLDVTISKRKKEDIAIADILLWKDRPSKDETKLFNTLKNQTLALMVLEEISERKIVDIKDINNLILSYYGNNKDQLRNDGWRIALLAKSVNLSNLVGQLRKEKEMLSFVRGIKNWNTMTNVLSYVLNNKNLADKLWNITKEDIDSDKTIMEIYGKNRFLVDEKSRILRILNSASKEDIQKIIDIKWRNGDVREAFNVKQMLKENESLVDANPFLLISDLNSTWSLDRSAEGMGNSHRWAEQQMYATFLSLADTKDVKAEWETDAQKQIVEWPKTTELIKWFARLLKWTVYESDKIVVEWDDKKTFENFKQFLKNNPDSIAMYRQRLDKLSYNKTVDLRDLLTAKWQESLSNREKAVAEVELNEIRDERKLWFENEIKKDPAAKEWYESLSPEDKLSTVRNIIDVMDKVPNAFLSLAGLSVTWNQNISEDDLKKTSNFKFNFLKDDAWIWPRVSLWFIGNQGVFEEWFLPYIDIPVISLTENLDLNQNAVANENMHWATWVDKLYGRVSGNIRGAIKCGVKGPNWVEDPKLSVSFGAAMEAALWWKRNYKEWIEVKSNKLWNVLSKAFENPDFSSKEAFKNSIKLDENDRYVRNNPELKTFIIDEVVDSLELLWVFSPATKSGNYEKNTKNLLDTILKWVVEEVKNRNMNELNWKTKLTRLWIFASIWAFLKLGKGQGSKWEWVDGWQKLETPLSRNLSVWVEASLSAWKMLYWPDWEKLLYMDESLRSWEWIESVKANTKEWLETAIENIFTASTITGLTTKVVEKEKGEHQMEIEVSDATLSKYNKNNISELFNIYVKKDQENNIAIEKNKIILWNVGKIDLVSRNYFDEFSLYLLVGWSWVEWCDNNRIKWEKLSNNMEWISFEKKYESTIPSEELKFNYEWFNFSEMDAQTLLELSRVDNQAFNKREWGNFIKAINENRIEDAKQIVLSMLDDFEKHFRWFRWMFDSLKAYLQNNNWDKLRQTLDRIKAIFATTESIHNDKGNVKAYWLKKNLEQRRNTFTTLDKSLELNKNDIDLRDKIVNNIIDENKYDIVRHDDLIWYTAFYARDNREWRWYSSTSLGNVGVYWNVVEKAASQDNVKEWLKNKIENDWTKQAIIDHVKNKLPDEVKNSITDEQVMNLLFSEEAVKVWDATISMEKAYVFYLLWECANESFGIQLKEIKVVMNKEWDTISVWAWWEVLTKTQTLDQKDLNAKVSIFSRGWTIWEKEEIPDEPEKKPDYQDWSTPSNGEPGGKDKTQPETDGNPIGSNPSDGSKDNSGNENIGNTADDNLWTDWNQSWWDWPGDASNQGDL